MVRRLKKVHPDERGRITLGEVAKGISSYDVHMDEHNRIILTPNVEIPAREAWLWKNKEAMASVRRGLAESAAGKAEPLGSFSQYADDEIE